VSDHGTAAHTDRADNLNQGHFRNRGANISIQEEIAMKKMFLIAAIAPVMVIGSSAGAAELPAFEARGFPISRHQVAVLGSANVQEQSAVATLTLSEMPASPHQIAVLTPRQRVNDRQTAMSGERATIGSARLSPVVAIEQPH
jgi:hypothetical protein